jgi:hypothetical protein
VNVIVPRRMNCPRKKRNKRSIETTPMSDPARVRAPETLDVGIEIIPGSLRQS